ncbi:MAG: S1/P1 nuclease [Rhodospirillaceae bacterium]
MRQVSAALALGFVLLAAPRPAAAWGDVGHRWVCRITWDHLSVEARDKVLDILDFNTREEFEDSCNWADAHREGHRETGPWHYVSVPKGATEVIMERDCPAETSCAVREIERQFAILTSQVAKPERARALMFLSHFVGDLHQPLHTGFPDDRRGSLLRVKLNGQDWTMHGVWDYALVEAEPVGADVLGARLRSYIPIERDFSGVDAPPLVWANESLALLRAPATAYVGNPGNGFELGEIYIQQNRRVAVEQISRAGVRLALWLERAMKHYP